MSNLEKIIQAQQPLLQALPKAEKGEIKVPDLKPLAGVLGVLVQHNDLLATRIRITGGELPIEKMLFIADLVEKVKPNYIHFSSRQNIQLHDVTPANAATVITECTANGLPFRGGGGDSLRNISITLASGIAKDKSSDLAGYAKYLSETIFDWDEAFKLPRKLKIAFASAADSALALRQDLGFVENNIDGKISFIPYGGGGFGRNAALALKLRDSITAAELPRAAKAMIALFNDHGDRENRGSARIRYIVKRLGEAEFIKLYNSYFDKLADTEFPLPPNIDKNWSFHHPLPKNLQAKNSGDTPEFKRWLKFATCSNRFKGEKSITLFVPGGVVSVKQFRKIANLLAKFKVPAIRFTIEQNIFIPSFPSALLPDFYAELKKLSFDLCFESFIDQLDACIGATVCKAGILDTPTYAKLVSKRLDDYFKQHPKRFTAKRANQIIRDIHFSGCPNSCVSHQAVRFGFQGMRRKIDGVLTDGFTLWQNPNYAPIGVEDPEFITVDKLPEKVIEMLKEAKMI